MNDRVLVVDDELYVRRLIHMVLEKAGFEVLVAATVEEGLRLLREAKPDALTLDLNMPGLGGFDLLTEKASDQAIRDVPTLLVTAVGLEEEVNRALSLGASTALNKPFSRRQLVDAIRKLLAIPD